jgi:hypothetical protein
VSTPAVEQRRGRPGAATGGSPGGANRIPAPVRERRPALAALAVLLIVGGALATGLIVMRTGARSDYLVVRTTIDPGQQIRAADLGVARIAGTGANAVPAGSRDLVVGRYATTRIFPGTLVTRQMVGAAPEIPTGYAVVGVVVSTAQRPAVRLRRGDLVQVLTVPRTDAATEPTATTLLDRAEVRAVADAATNGALAVSLLVPAAQLPPVVAAAAAGTVSLAAVPGVAQPATTATSGTASGSDSTASGSDSTAGGPDGTASGSDGGATTPVAPSAQSDATAPTGAPAADTGTGGPGAGAPADGGQVIQPGESLAPSAIGSSTTP